MRHLPRLFVAVATLATAVLPAQTISPDGHPRNGEVPLPAAGGWNAFLVHDAGIGIWTVKSYQVFDQYGCPEIVGEDEAGWLVAPNAPRQLADALAPYDPLFYEEPLRYDDPEGYADLRRRTRVPIAGGETRSLAQHASHDMDHITRPALPR